ncbi:MAG: ATP-dependent helicase [Lachnospiraceae bacterium]
MNRINENQFLAINHETGPMLVIAGPGSGKTFVITNRILTLINTSIAHPEEILVISFSKASALEMKERFHNLTSEFYPVHFATFHAFFYHILKSNIQYKETTILTNSEKKSIIHTLVKYHKNQNLSSIEGKEVLLSLIIKKKAGILIKDTDMPPFLLYHEFSVLYDQYIELTRIQQKIDFDDMGTLCYQLLKENKSVLDEWRKKFKFYLIDEFQDINLEQFQIINLLLNEEKNLFVVGDDDQAIYGFRGAKPEIMLGFKEYFKECKVVELDINYRSKYYIVETAKKIIVQNKNRFEKNIKANQLEAGTVILECYENKETQYLEIIEKIKEKRSIFSFQDFACIFRTNYDGMMLADFLTRENIPFVMKEYTKSIFEHFIAKDILSFLSFVFKEQKRMHFFQFMNKPTRYFSRELFKEEKIDLKTIYSYVYQRPYMLDIVRTLEYDIRRVKEMDFYSAIHYFVHKMNYKEYLIEVSKKNMESAKEYLDIVFNLQILLKNFQTIEDIYSHIEEYERKLKEAMKITKEGVHIITMHSSKGLEFPIVFLPDCNEGIIPHRKSAKETMEEERRLFYVGITRAKEEVYLSYVEDKNNNVRASQFLTPIKNTHLKRK